MSPLDTQELPGIGSRVGPTAPETRLLPETPSSLSDENLSAARAKILVIDDQSSERLLLREILQGVAPGARIIALADPLQAIDYCASVHIDLVVTDYRMPGLNGIELIRRLRSIPHMTEVPVICVTIVDDKLVKYQALDAGATDFLQRPLDPVECAARCRNLLAMRRHQLQHMEARIGERTSTLTVANRSLRKEIRQRKIAQSAMQEFSRRLQEMTRRLVSLDDKDKRRLARELHDRVSSSLMAIGLHIGLVRKHLPADIADDVLERLTDAADLVKQTMISSRQISSDLHPASLDYSGPYAALDDYVKTFAQKSGIHVSLTSNDKTLRLDPEKETALFRIVQEALLNCAKHARAHTIAIHLRATAAHLILSILDDGLGFDLESLGAEGSPPGIGLMSMRERAANMGAKLVIDARPGKGTLITLTI